VIYLESLLQTLFSSSFPESKESCIEMESIDSATMELILDYAYTGTIEITEFNVQAILQAASFLQVNTSLVCLMSF